MTTSDVIRDDLGNTTSIHEAASSADRLGWARKVHSQGIHRRSGTQLADPKLPDVRCAITAGGRRHKHGRSSFEALVFVIDTQVSNGTDLVTDIEGLEGNQLLRLRSRLERLRSDGVPLGVIILGSGTNTSEHEDPESRSESSRSVERIEAALSPALGDVDVWMVQCEPCRRCPTESPPSVELIVATATALGVEPERCVLISPLPELGDLAKVIGAGHVIVPTGVWRHPQGSSGGSALSLATAIANLCATYWSRLEQFDHRGVSALRAAVDDLTVELGLWAPDQEAK